MRARTRALWCRCCTLLCCRSLTLFRVGALSEVASKCDAFRTRRLPEGDAIMLRHLSLFAPFDKRKKNALVVPAMPPASTGGTLKRNAERKTERTAEARGNCEGTTKANVVTSHLARAPWNSNANESLFLLRDRGSWVRRVATELVTLVLGNWREITTASD